MSIRALPNACVTDSINLLASQCASRAQDRNELARHLQLAHTICVLRHERILQHFKRHRRAEARHRYHALRFLVRIRLTHPSSMLIRTAFKGPMPRASMHRLAETVDPMPA